MLTTYLSLLVAVAGIAGADTMCYSPVDVVQVQDMTSSFDSRWEAMSDQIGSVIQYIYDTNPESRFGFATFGDKPIKGSANVPLGYEDDYCLHVDVQIGTPTPEKMQTLFKNYAQKAQGGGGDWPEGVFSGLYRGLIAPQVGWAPAGTNTSRVVVVVTDATGHLDGDVLSITGENLPENTLTSDDLLSNENAKCAEVEYPSLDRIGKFIVDNNVQIIFIVAPGGTTDADGKFYPAASLAKYGKKYWNEDGLQLWYEDQLASVGVTAIVKTMDPGMEVYAQAFKDALKQYIGWRCDTTIPPSGRTTGPPVTTAPTSPPFTTGPPPTTTTTAPTTTPTSLVIPTTQTSTTAAAATTIPTSGPATSSPATTTATTVFTSGTEAATTQTSTSPASSATAPVSTSSPGETTSPSPTDLVTTTSSPTDLVTTTSSPTDLVTTSPSPTDLVTTTSSPTDLVTTTTECTGDCPCPDCCIGQVKVHVEIAVGCDPNDEDCCTGDDC